MLKRALKSLLPSLACCPLGINLLARLFFFKFSVIIILVAKREFFCSVTEIFAARTMLVLSTPNWTVNFHWVHLDIRGLFCCFVFLKKDEWVELQWNWSCHCFVWYAEQVSENREAYIHTCQENISQINFGVIRRSLRHLWTWMEDTEKWKMEGLHSAVWRYLLLASKGVWVVSFVWTFIH